MSDVDPVSAERLNGEPVIFRGCGASELMTIVMVSSLIIFPTVLSVATLANAFAMGMGIGAALLLGSVVLLATWFQRLKRGRPLGHYQQALKLWLENGGFMRSGAIRHDGNWDLGRRES